MGKVILEAIACAVESDYVTELRRHLKVEPPAPNVESWPWAVKIYSLGAFELSVNDVAVEFAGKAPKKVIVVPNRIVNVVA